MKRNFRDDSYSSAAPRRDGGNRPAGHGGPYRGSYGGPPRGSASGRGPSWGGERSADRGQERSGDRGSEGTWSRPRHPGDERQGERPPRRTYHREGAEGGWDRPYSRPHNDGSHGAAERGGRPRSPAPAAVPVPAPSAAPLRPVPVHRLKEGLRAANRAVAELMEEFGKGIEAAYDITELQAEVSFDEHGRFMGLGRGGSVTLTLTLTPLDAEQVFEAEGEPTAPPKGRHRSGSIASEGGYSHAPSQPERDSKSSRAHAAGKRAELQAPPMPVDDEEDDSASLADYVEIEDDFEISPAAAEVSAVDTTDDDGSNGGDPDTAAASAEAPLGR